MTIAFWCVLAAGLLPYSATIIAKSKPGFDNQNPRAWLQRQEGFRQRANAAQLNSFEGFPLFAAAVTIAHMMQAAQHTVDLLALVYVAARVLYVALYVANIATVRSLAWIIGMACCIGLFVVAAH